MPFSNYELARNLKITVFNTLFIGSPIPQFPLNDPGVNENEQVIKYYLC